MSVFRSISQAGLALVAPSRRSPLAARIRRGLFTAMLSSVLPLEAAESGAPKPEVRATSDAAEAAVNVIFTGFVRRADKGASVFVRMTGEVPVAAERSGRRLTYRLSGAKLGVANSGNPLPTEHFGPPVSHISLVPVSGGVELIIDLSGDTAEAAPPPHRLVSHGGLSTLHVELAPAAS
jgi:hypothetical protein